MNQTAIEKIRGLPMPSPDRQLMDNILAAGFAAYPERKANFDKFKAAPKSATVDYMPIRLDVEHVSRCNFRCTMCQVSEWPKQQRASDMSFEDFKALLDEQYGLVEIKLQGMGEPLLAADTFFEMIEYARARHLWVRSTVNGSLLHLKDNYKRLIDSDICEIQISIDGATKETYETIRLGGKFDMVTRNCRMLNDYAKADGRTRTRMWVVVQAGNYDELEKFPQLAADLGFERLTLSLDLNDWGQDSWRKRNDPLDVHHTFDADRGMKIADLGEALGVETTFWFIDDKYEAGNPAKTCPWPFERAYVSSDMRTVPCCMIATPEISDLGDARELKTTWNNKAMQEFRAAHIRGDIPKICQSCYKQNTKPT